ncbi:MAG: fructose-6-phosphate aldolase [Acidobacteria bacterium]|nr:fructose-6-phosphate aldolase [Acidobacteriota bacterium]
MRFFLDTVDPDEARRVREWGLLDGLVVRPEAADLAGKDYRRVLGDLAPLTDGPVMASLAVGETKAMYKEARELHKLGKAMVLRVPLMRESMRLVRLLADDQIATDMGLIFTAQQALVAARAGCAYVSVYVGTLDEIGQIGMDVVESIVRVYDNYGIQTQIVVQGAISPIHVLDGAMTGADVSAVPIGVLDAIFDHPLTKAGLTTLRVNPGDGPRRVH